ncbi:putative beta-carotene-binding protein [Zophobas morio]|uniref:putative beta-carotene-binding protein n=1 Tax=Zophobas morio TaxID=2755281 RepID=UPI0030833A6C
MYWLLVLQIVVACALAQQKLPSYIKPCSTKSPDFLKCALESANEAIPHIVKGDKSLGIPKLDPLRLPLIEVEQNNFKLSLKDVQIFGIRNIKATALNLDPSQFDATFEIENLNLVGTHHTDGKVLVLTLQGEGPANMTGVGGTYRVTAAVTRYTKGGLEYLKLEKPKIDFTLKRAYFQMDNLIAGDQKLSSDINQILNDSWQDVLKDVGAPIKETVSAIIESIVPKILDKVPEKEIFPE